MMALKLDLAAAFLPKRFLYLLHPFGFPAHIDSLERAPLGIPANCCYVISGSISFVRRVFAYPQMEPEWSIVHAEFPFRDYPGSRARSAHRYNLQQELLGLYLEPSNLSHFQFGGGTDAQYVVAVGRRADPEKRLRHCPPPPLRRGIRHFWEDATSGTSMTVCDTPAPLEGDSPLFRAYFVKHRVGNIEAARGEGLFPVANSNTLCIGNSVYHRGKSVLRRLSNREMLRLWDMPLSLDHLLESKTYFLRRGPAPFESAMTPNVWACVVRAIWARGKGGGLIVTIST